MGRSSRRSGDRIARTGASRRGEVTVIGIDPSLSQHRGPLEKFPSPKGTGATRGTTLVPFGRIPKGPHARDNGRTRDGVLSHEGISTGRLRSEFRSARPPGLHQAPARWGGG